jgi:hypothetical protein
MGYYATGVVIATPATVPPTPVPEPSVLTLFTLSIGCIAAQRLRRRP